MKRKAYAIVAIVTTLIIVCIGYVCIQHSEWGARCYINSHQNEIKEFAISCLEQGAEKDTYHGWQVDCYKNMGQVEFLVTAIGFGSSFSYKGVYYSALDTPLGFQGTYVDFVPYESGWLWEEVDGDNWQYTERISPNWFWFEAHF